MKNKTLALWLTFLVGPFGLHRLYIKGRMDTISWLIAIPTLLGLYGVQRAREFGLDDTVSWLLTPLFGLTLAGCALNAIVYGLMDTEKWNRLFNPTAPLDSTAGQTGWLTVIGLATALLIGTTVLMSTIAFSFQRYFEYQLEEAAQQVQTEDVRKPAD